MQDTAASLRLPILFAGIVMLAGVLILSVFGWLQYGSAIFISMAESGLSWCL